MGGFSLNSKNLAFIGLVIVSLLFALSRMPGGIGGTGITGTPGGIGGTGIYGRIDGFGSIWVNGVEIFYDEDQLVTRQGRNGLPNSLKIGQVVAVVIDEETGRAEAQSIEIIEEVNGPVEQLGDEGFVILGQKVILTDDTIIEGDLTEGTQLAVNGFRAPDDSIIASRIDKPLVEGEMSIRGAISRAEGGRYWIGDQEVEITGEQVSVGNVVELRGRLGAERRRLASERRRFIMEAIKKRRLPFDRRPARVSYQGAFENVPAIDVAKPAARAIEMSVVEFKPEVDDEVIVIPTPNANNRAAFKNTFKRERIVNQAIERRNAVQERRRQAEAEARRQAEIEARRQAEIEARRQAEIEARRQAEIEARRQAEIEARRQAEIEARRQAEIEARRQAELEARRQAEIEARRAAELEANRQAAIEARIRAQAEAQRQAQEEAREEDDDQQSEIQSELEEDTNDEFKAEIRRQIRIDARREAREEIRRRLRRQQIRNQIQQQ